MINYLKTFNKYKYMLKLFVSRDIEKKYKGAYLGVAWSLLNPLLQMIVLTIIFSALFSRDIVNFPMYLLTGKIIFDFFSSCTNASLKSITGSAALLKKINFPKYMVVLSTVISNFIIFLISFIDLFLIMLITKVTPQWSILIMPVYLLLFFIFVLGFSLLLSILNAYFRDIQHLYSVFIMFLTYFSAIFYPTDIVPEQFQFLFKLNPVYQFIEGFRAILYEGILPNFENLLICTFYTVLSLIIGTIVFIKYKDEVINEL